MTAKPQGKSSVNKRELVSATNLPSAALEAGAGFIGAMTVWKVWIELILTVIASTVGAS